MPSIRPVSDLRNHFAEITKEVQESREPVFLTKNGVGSIVVMSMESYEQNRYDSMVYDKLREAEIGCMVCSSGGASCSRYSMSAASSAVSDFSQNGSFWCEFLGVVFWMKLFMSLNTSLSRRI